ncbi:MAG: VWA domain-containing protein [Deltaproteobacteria bacterium]|nr:VWA domain-containing protein [Deltaproteobacteria bacterium]
MVVAIALSIVALARPRWGFRWEEIRRRGVDIVVALDVSQSMMATDVDPNRLERAKRKIQDLLTMLRGDRIGLVAFAGSSFIQCPLTLDYGAFRIFLDGLSPDLIPVPGTAVARAIETSLTAFDPKLRTSKAIILITDGEDHGGNPLSAAKKAKEAGVKIFTIGIGKREGAPIPLAGPGGGFKKDHSGNLILTRLDEETLKKIALTTGGAYVHSVTGDMDLQSIYLKGIRMGMKQTELATRRKKRWTERFEWPLMAAVFLLIAEGFLREGGREEA